MYLRTLNFNLFYNNIIHFCFNFTLKTLMKFYYVKIIDTPKYESGLHTTIAM